VLQHALDHDGLAPIGGWRLANDENLHPSLVVPTSGHAKPIV